MNKYTEFKKIKDKEEYNIYNKIYDIKVGRIKKARMGTWMHWQLYFTVKFMKKMVEKNQDLGFSNGCLKEISKFITTLYSKKMEKKGKFPKLSPEDKERIGYWKK